MRRIGQVLRPQLLVVLLGALGDQDRLHQIRGIDDDELRAGGRGQAMHSAVTSNRARRNMASSCFRTDSSATAPRTPATRGRS